MKHRCSYRVIYGDTDQMAVVYYANYLRWFERGRSEFLRAIGLPYPEIESRGCRFPVTEVSCRYHRPAHFDEMVLIETELARLERVTLTFAYRILKEPGEMLLAQGWTRHACVDTAGKIKRIPKDLEENLRSSLTPEPCGAPRPRE